MTDIQDIKVIRSFNVREFRVAKLLSMTQSIHVVSQYCCTVKILSVVNKMFLEGGSVDINNRIRDME